MKQNEQKTPPKESNKALTMIKSVLSSTCGFFTVFTMLILTTQLFGSNDLIQPLKFFMLFPFALCISVANLIFKAKSINTFLKLIIHFAILTASFYLCFFTSSQNVKPLALILLLGVLYIIIATPILIILKLKKKKSEPKPEYVSMFKGASKS